LTEIGRIFDRNKLGKKESLYDYLEDIFYRIDEKVPVKDIRRLIILMKEIITSLIIDKKVDSDDSRF
jgi:hypothetical protein